MGRKVGLAKGQVLEAAASLVEETGAEELTLAAVADRLGVKSQSLYAHVNGLPGLRRDLILAELARSADRLRRAVMAKARRQALLALMEEMVAVSREKPGMARVASWNNPDPNDVEMFDAILEAMEPMSQVLASYGLEGDELAHWLRIIWSSFQGFVNQEPKMVLPADHDESLHLLMKTFADGLDAVAADHERRLSGDGPVAGRPTRGPVGGGGGGGGLGRGER
jgi:AcrR family transcriptional regulator